MVDVQALVAFLRQRRIDLGLTRREVVQRIGMGVDHMRLWGCEDDGILPSLPELIAWADMLGCDVTLTIRPEPPLKGRSDSLDELRQDLHDNAWARRVAAPAIPDDLDELRRRLDEVRAITAVRTRVEIDPNVRCRGNQTHTGIEDCHGPVAVGDEVTVYEEPEHDDLGEQMRHRKLGVYRLYWKSGGASVAAVGMLYDGTRWYAPANWTTGSVNADRSHLVGTDWSRVERVELIEPYRHVRGPEDVDE